MSPPPDDPPLLARLLAPRSDPDAPPSPSERWWDRASWLLFAVTFIAAIAVYGDYGITWDEWAHIGYGEHIARYWGTGFADTEALTFRLNYYYGGGYDLLGAAFRWLARPLPEWRAFHLLGGLVGALGVVGTWKLGRRLAGPFAGFAAALLLVLNPVWFGHMFNNPKDMPFAVGYVWSLYYVIDAVARFPRVPRRVWIKLALAIGLAMSVRIAGVLLLCYLGLAAAIYAALQGALRRSAAAAWSYFEHLGLRIAAVGAAAWAIMLVAWPWALQDPLRRPFITLGRMSQYTAHKRRMPFNGEDIWNFDVGWNYLPHYFGYQLPEAVLALFLIATVVGVTTVVNNIRDPRRTLPALALLILGVSIWMPPIYAILKGSILYDAYRHFLFVVPPLTVLAALLLDSAVALLARRIGRAASVVAVAFLALVGGDLLRTMIALHPHEYVYFNRLIGGVGGAHLEYDTDYYGNTFKEAAEGLAAWTWANDRASYLDTVYYYSGCMSPAMGDRYLPPNFREYRSRPGKDKRADFFLGYTRGHCDRRHPSAPVVFSVQRGGADLNLVKDLRGQPDPKPGREAKRAAARERPQSRPAQPKQPVLAPDVAARRAARTDINPNSGGGDGVMLAPIGPALPPELAAERAKQSADKPAAEARSHQQ